MKNVLNIKLEKLYLSDIKLATAGIRPYRKGGIRFEEEIMRYLLERMNFSEKIIFHNYGHGGAGVSMSYGCAKLMTMKLLSQYPQSSNSEIAVLGGGYMGLFTAKILTEKGFRVKLYTKQMPFANVSGSCEIASQAAAGFWLPYGYDLDTSNKSQKEFHDSSSKITFDFFKESMIQQKYRGIKKITCIFLNSNPKVTFKDFIPSSIDMNYQNQLVSINGGDPVLSVTMESLMIEGRIFLQDLIKECESLGVKFVNHTFKNYDDVKQLKEQVIFNCLGLNSGEVFGDKGMDFIKGQIVYCEAFKDFNYYISFTTVKGESVTTYPHQQYTGIGLTKERSNSYVPTIESSQILLNNYNEMVKENSKQQKKEVTPQIQQKLLNLQAKL